MGYITVSMQTTNRFKAVGARVRIPIVRFWGVVPATLEDAAMSPCPPACPSAAMAAVLVRKRRDRKPLHHPKQRKPRLRKLGADICWLTKGT